MVHKSHTNPYPSLTLWIYQSTAWNLIFNELRLHIYLNVQYWSMGWLALLFRWIRDKSMLLKGLNVYSMLVCIFINPPYFSSLLIPFLISHTALTITLCKLYFNEPQQSSFIHHALKNKRIGRKTVQNPFSFSRYHSIAIQIFRTQNFIKYQKLWIPQLVYWLGSNEFHLVMRLPQCYIVLIGYY